MRIQSLLVNRVAFIVFGFSAILMLNGCGGSSSPTVSLGSPVNVEPYPDGSVELMPATPFVRPNDDLIKAWTASEAVYGYMYTDNAFYEACQYREEGNGKTRGWPAFIYGSKTVEGLGSLPIPEMEFGLCLTECKIDEAEFLKLERFKSICLLECFGTKLSEMSVQSLKKLPQLRALGLQDTGLTDVGLKHLGVLSELEILDICDNQITDAGLASVTALTKLRSINLRSSDNITDKGVSLLIKLDKLEALNLMTCPITDHCLKALCDAKQLKFLDLNDTAITDAGLEYLVKLKTLTLLKIKTAQTTKAGRTKLQNALPNCRIEE